MATLRRGIAQDARQEILRRQAVYCGDNTVLARIQNGRRIYLDIRDASLAAGLALGDEWEPHVARVLKDMAKPGDTFFDVGANVGYHSLLLRDVVMAGDGQMHLFEPNPNIFRLLQRSIHANAFWRGTFVRCLALSDSDGQAKLTVYEDFWGGGRLQDPEDLNSSQNPWSASAVIREQFDVRLTTVDAYCAEQGIDHIDLMKIDVEGHEDSVFAGMSRMLDQSPALSVVMEFTFGAYGDAEEFWQRLSALFPHRYFISDRGLEPVASLQDLRRLATTELADILLSRAPAPGSPNAPQG